jgi:hypothetical protein
VEPRGEPELRGTVVSAETGRVIAGAWIALEGEDWGTFSWNDGHFFLPEIPGDAREYDVRALGYEAAVMTLDPSDRELVIELVPEPEVLEGLAYFMDQLQTRRQRGGYLRAFDREALAFQGYFSLAAFLSAQGVEPVRHACLNERPEPIGIVGRSADQFYLVEIVGGNVRLYTEDFVETAARERYQLQREPGICSGPVGRAEG